MKKFTSFCLILLLFIVNPSTVTYASENNPLSQEEINTILQSENNKYISDEQEEILSQNLDEIIVLNELELENKLKELKLDEVVSINEEETIIDKKSSRAFFPPGAFSIDFIDKTVTSNTIAGGSLFSVTLYAINLSPCTVRQFAGNVIYTFITKTNQKLSYTKFVDMRFIYTGDERRERISYMHAGLYAEYRGEFIMVTKEHGAIIINPSIHESIW